MRNSIILLLASLFICSIASAEGDGGYAGAFLRGGIGARPLGMGGAFTAIAEGLTLRITIQRGWDIYRILIFQCHISH